MDITTLKYFCHLAHSLHFGKTSRQCFVSPSTLSRMIQRLEEELGTPLFERTNRSVLLTGAGQQFLVFAEKTVAELEQVRGAMANDPARIRGILRIFCSVTASYSILPPLLSRFHAAYPLVEVELVTGDVEAAPEMVVSGQADLAITTTDDKTQPGLSYIFLQEIPMIFIGPAAETKMDLAQSPFILPMSGHARALVETWCAQANITPRCAAKVAGYEGAVSLVALGLGFSLVPELVLAHSSLRSEIRQFEVAPGVPSLQAGLIVNVRRLRSGVIRAFWDLISVSQK